MGTGIAGVPTGLLSVGGQWGILCEHPTITAWPPTTTAWPPTTLEKRQGYKETKNAMS